MTFGGFVTPGVTRPRIGSPEWAAGLLARYPGYVRVRLSCTRGEPTPEPGEIVLRRGRGRDTPAKLFFGAPVE